MTFLFLYTLGFTRPEEPNISTGMCISISAYICQYLPASTLPVQGKGLLYPLQMKHLQETAPLAQHPPYSQISSHPSHARSRRWHPTLWPSTLLNRGMLLLLALPQPSQRHPGAAIRITSVMRLHERSAAKPQSPAGRGQGCFCPSLLPPPRWWPGACPQPLPTQPPTGLGA